MHILFLTDNFPPETNAPASRTHEHAREWVRLGARVTVITGNPNFPEGRLMSGHRNRLRPQRRIVDGIEVIRVWSYITANEGFVKRVLDHISFAVMAFFAGLRVKPDVIVATSPQFFTSWAGWALSKAKRRPWIFELRDLWPESIVAVGAMKLGPLLRLLERIELALYHDAARVVALTDAFKANLVARGIPAAKIEVVTNGVALDQFTPRRRTRPCSRASASPARRSSPTSARTAPPTRSISSSKAPPTPTPASTFCLSAPARRKRR